MDYDNFFLPAEDLESAKEFYKNILGLDVKFDFSDNGMVAFKVANQEPAIILQDKKKFPDAKPAILFVVEDVNEIFNKLKDKVKFLTDKPYKIYTGLAIQFEDPSGNRLGFTDYSAQNKN